MSGRSRASHINVHGPRNLGETIGLARLRWSRRGIGLSRTCGRSSPVSPPIGSLPHFQRPSEYACAQHHAPPSTAKGGSTDVFVNGQKATRVIFFGVAHDWDLLRRPLVTHVPLHLRTRAGRRVEETQNREAVVECRCASSLLLHIQQERAEFLGYRTIRRMPQKLNKIAHRPQIHRLAFWLQPLDPHFFKKRRRSGGICCSDIETSCRQIEKASF